MNRFYAFKNLMEDVHTEHSRTWITSIHYLFQTKILHCNTNNYLLDDTS